MTEVKTLAGLWYTVTAPDACVVTAALEGKESPLATLAAAGQTAFHAVSSKVRVSNDSAVVMLADSSAALALALRETGEGAAVVEEVQLSPAGSAEDNFNSYGFACIITRSGKITQLDIECRHSGSAEPADTPIYVKVWRGTTLLARSTNAQTHAIEATLTYTFEPFDVAEGDELRVTYHTEGGMETDAYQMGRIVCQRAVALTEGETGGMLNSQGGFSSQSYVAKYVWHMRILKDTLAEHIDDVSAHVSADDRTRWDNASGSDSAGYNWLAVSACGAFSSVTEQRIIYNDVTYNLLPLSNVGANFLYIFANARVTGTDLRKLMSDMVIPDDVNQAEQYYILING